MRLLATRLVARRLRWRKKSCIEGNPVSAHVSTPYVERKNLTMRVQMCHFTRLTLRLRSHHCADLIRSGG